MSGEHLKIGRINKGTVIDHIDAGYAMTILSLTGLDKSTNLMTIGVNVPSEKYKKKDIVKIENVFLNDVQTQKIAILSSNATISLIENSHVIEKKKVSLPKVIKKIIICVNKTCISNSNKEPICSEFIVLEEKPLKIQCAYCDRIYDIDEIMFGSKEKIEKKATQDYKI
ncbi:MAG: aspartate carbamoyltransferase regulatory subunit [Promethearchaeota archaeon]